MNDAKIASCNAYNRSKSFLISKIIDVDVQSQMIPTLFKQLPRFLLREHMKLVDEPNVRIESRIACQAFLQCWLTNEDQAEIPPIIEVSQLLQSCHFQAVGLIDFGI